MHILEKEYILPRNLDRKSNTFFLFHRINDEERLEFEYNFSFDLGKGIHDAHFGKRIHSRNLNRKNNTLFLFHRINDEERLEFEYNFSFVLGKGIHDAHFGKRIHSLSKFKQEK